MDEASRRLKELKAAKAKGDHVDPSEMSQLEASHEAARVEHDRLFPQYEALPEEADAFEIQKAARSRYNAYVKEESDKAPITVRDPQP